MRKNFTIVRRAPFIKLLLPLAAGIFLQWQYRVPPVLSTACLLISLVVVILPFLFRLSEKLRYQWINAVFIQLVFISAGCLLLSRHDIRDKQGKKFPREPTPYVALIKEPLVEKTNSYRTVARIRRPQNRYHESEDIVLYFPKDSLAERLNYGMRLVFKKPLREITSTGNPGGFDYKTYCLFQGLTHQVYLGPNDFLSLPGQEIDWWRKFLFDSRQSIVGIVRKYIRGEKERGLAEALLIGYKEDLDKDLVQSYANTGVVHVIAISGLHLGLIYWLLVQLLMPLRKFRRLKWIRLAFIICCLWLFSLLAGAQPSVLRSALMFTCIALGESLSRDNSIINSLAFSAFILLCIDPFWIWNAGFQLSYAAVLSIIIFMKKVYGFIYLKNKMLDLLWKMNAVTIAAQILTTPLSLYHFHQFPNFFLLSNLLAIPLSSLILLGEILMCGFSFCFPFAKALGDLLSLLIRLLNGFVEHIDALPGSVWKGISINVYQVVLLFLLVVLLWDWFVNRSSAALKGFSICLLGILVFRTLSFIECSKRMAFIVYNVPKSSATGMVCGRETLFLTDEMLVDNQPLFDFHLRPSLIVHRTKSVQMLAKDFHQPVLIRGGGKNIMLLGSMPPKSYFPPNFQVDVLVLTGNARLRLNDIVNSFYPARIIFDSSTPSWKIQYWQRACDSLDIPCHNVIENGAFVMSLR